MHVCSLFQHLEKFEHFSDAIIEKDAELTDGGRDVSHLGFGHPEGHVVIRLLPIDSPLSGE